ncbi:hypothetical protein [Sporomusa aerivorans]|uniref:hypothetical protein n=1 Tax=Sporomusa aerivorans TaxID=204936 RepID=UPI00352B6372
MFEFLWWALLQVIGTGLGYYTAGVQSAIFMALVGALGGVFLLIEKKLHPVIDAARNGTVQSK